MPSPQNQTNLSLPFFPLSKSLARKQNHRQQWRHHHHFICINVVILSLLRLASSNFVSLHTEDCLSFLPKTHTRAGFYLFVWFKDENQIISWQARLLYNLIPAYGPHHVWWDDPHTLTTVVFFHFLTCSGPFHMLFPPSEAILPTLLTLATSIFISISFHFSLLKKYHPSYYTELEVRQLHTFELLQAKQDQFYIFIYYSHHLVKSSYTILCHHK